VLQPCDQFLTGKKRRVQGALPTKKAPSKATEKRETKARALLFEGWRRTREKHKNPLREDAATTTTIREVLEGYTQKNWKKRSQRRRSAATRHDPRRKLQGDSGLGKLRGLRKKKEGRREKTQPSALKRGDSQERRRGAHQS